MGSDQMTRPAALVTGSAIRLGKGIALALAEAGHDIALHYNSSEKQARETAAAIRATGVECDCFKQDLRQADELYSFLEEVVNRFPGLQVLINSASAYTQASIGETSASIFDLQFEVNLRAPFLLTKSFAELAKQGNIINIIDNKIGFNQYEYAAYLLSKKALAEFTRMAALELAPNIRVNGVAPGVVLPASRRSQEYIEWRIQGIPLQMQGEVSNITAAILSLLENPFVTGQVLIIDGGESLTNVGRHAGDYDQDKV